MKLLRVELANFQAHASAIVPFGPTITTIRGETDMGKSAVLRALRWVCQNNLTGAEFVRFGQKEATVTLHFLDEQGEAHTLQRIRRAKGSGNTYVLDGEELKAFSTSVPDNVAALLALNEINFQDQHDPPFWFTESPAEVSRRLNTVVDLSVIDTSLSAISAKVRRGHDAKALHEIELEKVVDKLAECEPQRERIQEFEELKQLRKDATKAKRDHTALGEIVGRAKERVQQEETADAHYLAIKEVLKAGKEWQLAQRHHDGLAELIDSAKKAHAAIDERGSINTKQLDAAFKTYQTKKKAWEDLKLLVGGATEAQSRVNKQKGSIKNAQMRLREEFSECPTCNRPL